MFKFMFLFLFFGEEEAGAGPFLRVGLVGLWAETKKRIGNSHRGRLDIIADILEASYDGTKKTYLMYRCNLSFKQLKYYLVFLFRKGLLCSIIDDGNSNFSLLKITNKGKEFLKAYKGLKAFIK